MNSLPPPDSSPDAAVSRFTRSRVAHPTADRAATAPACSSGEFTKQARFSAAIGRGTRHTGTNGICRSAWSGAIMSRRRQSPPSSRKNAADPAAGQVPQLVKGRSVRMRESGSETILDVAVIASVKWYDPVKGFGFWPRSTARRRLLHASQGQSGLLYAPRSETVTWRWSRVGKATTSRGSPKSMPRPRPRNRQGLAGPAAIRVSRPVPTRTGAALASP